MARIRRCTKKKSKRIPLRRVVFAFFLSQKKITAHPFNASCLFVITTKQQTHPTPKPLPRVAFVFLIPPIKYRLNLPVLDARGRRSSHAARALARQPHLQHLSWPPIFGLAKAPAGGGVSTSHRRIFSFESGVTCAGVGNR